MFSILLPTFSIFSAQLGWWKRYLSKNYFKMAFRLCPRIILQTAPRSGMGSPSTLLLSDSAWLSVILDADVGIHLTFQAVWLFMIPIYFCLAVWLCITIMYSVVCCLPLNDSFLLRLLMLDLAWICLFFLARAVQLCMTLAYLWPWFILADTARVWFRLQWADIVRFSVALISFCHI